ncbi:MULTISPECIES: SDR family NAD(P)-dependent oxidoreductase [Comamonas]|uniref:Oxidoreductase n=1 Tax=Comamonas testosteroni TaxID=285 RepID=A0A096FI22_COMTE|nr:MULTISPECIES: SDR family NAD(P)-dependent oxidoreductase [Comamonas]KGH29398.1 oxidoreductase [Comamonas testosteroni]MPT11083.1 SDR family NAD(P)-dependent oxidoreductase [Comamonas sp.]
MKVAVITGAASGIGAGLAKKAVSLGMKVVVADRDQTGLEKVALELGDQALAVATDVTSQASLDALADKAYAAFGQVDLLFNNAGVLSTGNSWEISDAKWQQAWQVNVNGIVNGLRAFVPRLLRANRPARIINTASVGGFLPSAMMAPYSATKFAVVALTEGLAGELAAINPQIKVSLLAPGPVKTAIFREAPGTASAQFHGMMTHMLDENGMDTEEFANRVFASIDRGEYWIVPQPEMLDPLLKARNKLIETRADPVLSWTQETAK